MKNKDVRILMLIHCTSPSKAKVMKSKRKHRRKCSTNMKMLIRINRYETYEGG